MPISLARAGAGKGGAGRASDGAFGTGTAAARRAFDFYVRRVLRREGVTRPTITVVLADDRLLRELNRDYRQIDRATDVLSFTYRDTDGMPGPRALEGELYISLDRVHAQARRYRHTAGDELLRLVTHGLLHLCGHDHVQAAERKVMRAAERRVLAGDVGAPERRAFAVLAGKESAP